MKRSTLHAFAIGCVAIGWAIEPPAAGRNTEGGTAGMIAPALTQAESADLLSMREREKLAYDINLRFFIQWGNPLFDKISKSEQRHADTVLGLLDRYGLPDPASEFGRFADAGLQSWFDALAESGMQGGLEALMAGALVEEVNLEHVAAAMNRTRKPDLQRVYGNLRSGAECCLATFVKSIEGVTGESYIAQRMAREDIEAILGR